MPFTRPTLSQLIASGRAHVETELPGADSRLRPSFLDVLVRLQAIMTTGNYGYLDYISRQSIPDTATEETLRRWCVIFGVPELPPAFAVGSVTATGTNGASVPAGARLRRADATEYVTTAPATIALGTATLSVTAAAAGTGGNAETGVALQFVSPILGVQLSAAVAAPGISGGLDSESEESLRQRLIERIQRPPAGGSVSDYQRRAKLHAGVTDVFVYAGLRPTSAKASYLGTTVDAEVNGAWTARGAVARLRVVVYWRSTNLANGEVVSLALNLQDATDVAGAGAADFGAPVSVPALFTAPGSGGPHTAEAVSEYSFDVRLARAFLRSQQTLTTSGTGTATWSVQLAMEGDLGVVYVVPLFYERANPIPTSPDLSAVAALLNDPAWKPITAEIDVVAPTAVPVNLTIVSTATAEVRAAVEASLRDLFRREAVPGGTLLLSHLREAISTAPGETDHSLTTPSANVSLAGDVTKISTLGTITWM